MSVSAGKLNRWRWVPLFILGVVFIVAAVPKALDPQAFFKAIQAYKILPSEIALFLAFYVPWLELVLVAGLGLRAWRRAALLIQGVMVLGFMGAILSAIIRGLNISCGCWGAGTFQPTLWMSLGIDALLLVVVAWAWANERSVS
jgi:putative oxidoreductase